VSRRIDGSPWAVEPRSKSAASVVVPSERAGGAVVVRTVRIHMMGRSPYRCDDGGLTRRHTTVRSAGELTMALETAKDCK
jgi:hypothetical protein